MAPTPAAARPPALRARTVGLALVALGLVPALVAAPAALLLLAAALLPVLLLWRGLSAPERGLAVFTWLLPFHTVTIAVLFGGLRVPEAAVRAIASWKELLVLWLVAAVAVRAVAGRGPARRVIPLDLGVAILIVAAVAHAAVERLLARSAPPLVAQAYGVRDLAFFLLLYFVGRATPSVADDPRTLGRFVAVAVVTSLIAIPERFLVPPELLVLIGVSSYFTTFLGASEYTGFNDYGLPTSYWSRFGDVEVRRAGSVYLSGQGFAVPFLVLLPAATVWLLDAPPGRRKRRALAYAVVWAGLLLTFTRVTIVACALQVALILLWRRRTSTAVLMVAAGALSLVAAMAAWPALARFLWDTLTWQTGSSVSHANDWQKGIVALFEHPFGAGVGTSDMTAIRFDRDPLTADNLYLKYAVELGAPFGLVFLAVVVGVAVTAFRLASTDFAPRAARALGMATAAAAVGMLLNGMTAVLTNNAMLAYLFFWLAGAVASRSADATDAALAAQRPV